MSNGRRWTREELLVAFGLVVGSVDEFLADFPYPLLSKSGYGLAAGGVGDSGG